jgi:phosphoribosylformimino-5-aminoimidazole carboxamide ribotide isomerase
MQIVPVMDLKGGVVVRARHGERAAYRPIETPLSQTSEPADVAAGLMALHAFNALYVADLDAIERRGNHEETIAKLSENYPRLSLWVDNGCAEIAQAERLLATLPGASLVIGSESQRDLELLRHLRNSTRIILSLDFRGEAFLGPEELLVGPELWPERVIIMTLARVGSDAGPDLETFAEIRARAGGRKIYLAGGLRNGGDLAAAKASGAAGILVASALHDGTLSAADLADFDGEPPTGAPVTGAPP